MPKTHDFISIIIPGYNEEKRILPTLRALVEFCGRNFQRYEIIFVDDGSTDKTLALVNTLAPTSHLQVVRLSKNRGKGYAVKTGMLRAHGRYRFFTDADLPYALNCFLSAMEIFDSPGCDMVVGARDLPGSYDMTVPDKPRTIASRVFSQILNSLLKIDIRDTQCGFKGFTEEAAKRVFAASTVRGYAFDVEIFVLARKFGLNITKIPLNLVRSEGTSIRIMRDAFNMFTDILRLYSRQRKGV